MENTNVLLTAEEEKMFRRVPLNEEESEHLAAEPYSYWKSVFRIFIRKPSAVIGLSVFLILIIGMIIIPFFCPEGWLESNVQIRNVSPNSQHFFGTDIVGRDLFFMLWEGLRKSLILALITSAINIVFGTIVGLIWGFFRKLDPIFIEIYNLISNVPSILMYMLLSVIISRAFPSLAVEIRLIIALCIFGWIGVALFIRNFTLIINDREYNVASKTLVIPGMISSEVSLTYFGFGLPSSSISIGSLLNNGRRYFMDYPWQLLFPAFFLAVVIFVFYLVGLALSDSLDPKKHR